MRELMQKREEIIKAMTRDEAIEKMFNMIARISGKNAWRWTWTSESKIWTLCGDWNTLHEDESEIFMCEMRKDAGDVCTGVMIEDDYFCTCEEEFEELMR